MYRELKKKRGIVDDHENMATFGTKVGNQYTVDDFIRFNEEIENIRIPSYDGNPNTFGDPEPSASQNSLSLLIKPGSFLRRVDWGQGAFFQVLPRLPSSPTTVFDVSVVCLFGNRALSSIVFPEGNTLVSDSEQIQQRMFNILVDVVPRSHTDASPT